MQGLKKEYASRHKHSMPAASLVRPSVSSVSSVSVDASGSFQHGDLDRHNDQWSGSLQQQQQQQQQQPQSTDLGVEQASSQSQRRPATLMHKQLKPHVAVEHAVQHDNSRRGAGMQVGW